MYTAMLEYIEMFLDLVARSQLQIFKQSTLPSFVSPFLRVSLRVGYQAN